MAVLTKLKATLKSQSHLLLNVHAWFIKALLSTLSEQWMQGPRSRPSPSDSEWRFSIFSDHTDPIVRSKLMESSLNTGFPLQQQSVFVLGGCEWRTSTCIKLRFIRNIIVTQYSLSRVQFWGDFFKHCLIGILHAGATCRPTYISVSAI